MKIGIELFFAKVGDSRTILAQEGGKYKQMILDHKPHIPKEKERILKSGGEVKNGRINGIINVSRSFGDF